jgi:hypothetical protein
MQRIQGADRIASRPAGVRRVKETPGLSNRGFRCCSELESKGTEFYGGTAPPIATKEPPSSTNQPGHRNPPSCGEVRLARRLRLRCDAHHKKAFCAARRPTPSKREPRTYRGLKVTS